MMSVFACEHQLRSFQCERLPATAEGNSVASSFAIEGLIAESASYLTIVSVSKQFEG